MKAQSYRADHSINITGPRSLDLIDDLKDDVSIVFTENEHQHYNHMTAIKSFPNWQDYDLFLKIDDDDIYKKDYIKNAVEFHLRNEVDVSSTACTLQCIGNQVTNFYYRSFAGAVESQDNFGIPATLVFNKRAVEFLMTLQHENGAYEDKTWRRELRKAGFNIQLRPNVADFGHHVHTDSTCVTLNGFRKHFNLKED